MGQQGVTVSVLQPGVDRGNSQAAEKEEVEAVGPVIHLEISQAVKKESEHPRQRTAGEQDGIPVVTADQSPESHEPIPKDEPGAQEKADSPAIGHDLDIVVMGMIENRIAGNGAKSWGRHRESAETRADQWERNG